MKKYKLQDLVANGSHSRIKVDSDLLVGDIKNGYGYGDVLDANATKAVAINIADDKVNTAKLELMSMIYQANGVSELNLAEVFNLIGLILTKNSEQDAKDAEIIQQIIEITQQIHSTLPIVGGDNDNLIF